MYQRDAKETYLFRNALAGSESVVSMCRDRTVCVCMCVCVRACACACVRVCDYRTSFVNILYSRQSERIGSTFSFCICSTILKFTPIFILPVPTPASAFQLSRQHLPHAHCPCP